MRTGPILCLLAVLLLSGGCSIQREFGFESRSGRYAKQLREERERIGTGYDRTTEQAEAEFERAFELVVGLRYDEAAEKLLPLIGAFGRTGRPERAAEAAFWAAYCYEKTDRPDDARRLYDQVLHDYAQTRAAPLAAARLARIR